MKPVTLWSERDWISSGTSLAKSATPGSVIGGGPLVAISPFIGAALVCLRTELDDRLCRRRERFQRLSFMNDMSGMTVSPAKLVFGKVMTIVVESSSQSLGVINNRGEAGHPERVIG